MLDPLIDFIQAIWDTDKAMRESGTLGESPLEKESRHLTAWLCGGAITLLMLVSLVWWWLSGQ